MKGKEKVYERLGERRNEGSWKQGREWESHMREFSN